MRIFSLFVFLHHDTMFHKKDTLILSLFYLSRMVINLHEIFIGCSRRKINSKYLNVAQWLLDKYCLLVVM